MADLSHFFGQKVTFGTKKVTFGTKKGDVWYV